MLGHVEVGRGVGLEHDGGAPGRRRVAVGERPAGPQPCGVKAKFEALAESALAGPGHAAEEEPLGLPVGRDGLGQVGHDRPVALVDQVVVA